MTEEFSDDTLGFDDDSDAGIGGSDEFFDGLSEAFMSDVESVELGDDGSIEMKVREQEPEPAAPGSEDSLSSADTPGQPAGGQPSPDAQFLEGQYKEVQGWATRVSQENAELKAAVAELQQGMDHGSTDSAEAEGDEFDMDPELQSQLDSYMEKNLGAVLSQKLGIPQEELGQLLQEASINRELRAAYATLPDFEMYMPVMQEISEQYPDLNYDQLYGLATTFYQPADAEGDQTEDVDAQETAPPQAITPAAPAAAPQSPQESPVQRAQRLQTLESQSNDDGYEPGTRVTSIQEAAEKALREMG